MAANIREQIKKYIDKADDKTVIMIHALLEAEQKYDWWDELPEAVKASVDKALKEANEGKGIPHEEVVKKYKEWFAK